jgi:hypothetical protein
MFVVHELSSQTNFPDKAGRYANTVSKMISAHPAPHDRHALFITSSFLVTLREPCFMGALSPLAALCATAKAGNGRQSLALEDN